MRLLRRIVDSPVFAGVVLAVIVANAVVLGMQTYPGLVRDYGSTLEFLNDVFLAFFVVELTLRIAAYGRRPHDFFRSGWNVFDFVAVASSFIPGLSNMPAVLRLIRLLRVLRLARVLPDARVLVAGVVRSLPPLLSVVVLMFLLFFVYGMVGWLLFGDELPNDWGNVGRAMLSLFFVLTLAEVSRLTREAMEVHPAAWLYFVSFVVFAVYLALNTMIAIVLNAMEEARRIEREVDVRDVK